MNPRPWPTPFPWPSRHALALFVLVVWMWTMGTVARAPMAISLLALALVALLSRKRTFPYVQLADETRSRWRGLLRRPDYYLPGVLMCAYALGMLWCADTAFLQRRVQLSAQAFGIPLIFYLLAVPIARHKERLWIAFGTFAAVLGATVALYTRYNLGAVLVALGYGRVVPTPIGHVRFAMLLAVAAVALAWVLASNLLHRGQRPRWWVWISGGLLLTLVAALHVIAVRTGLVMLYLGGGLLLLRLVIWHFSWRQTVIAGGLFLASFGGLALTSPTLVRKLQFTAWDLDQFGEAGATEYSDVVRITSMRIGWTIVKDSPWLGASRVGLRQRMEREYVAAGFEPQPQMPHNQWLFSWASVGVLGFLGVTAVLVAPAFRQNWYRQPLVAEMVGMVAVICVVEVPFESDVGIGLCMLAVYLAKAGDA